MKARIAILVSFVLAASLVGPWVAFAGPGDQSGGGGGSAIALAIQNSLPTDGATGVPTPAQTLWIQYTHDVADPSVAAINIPLVSIAKADGTPVQSTVWTLDPNISAENFAKRQYIYLDVGALAPGTTYVITAAAGIRAQNGLVTAAGLTTQAARVSFTTAGIAPGAGSIGNTQSAKTGNPASKKKAAKKKPAAKATTVAASSETTTSDQRVTLATLAGASSRAATVAPTAIQASVNADITSQTAASAIAPIPDAGSGGEPLNAENLALGISAVSAVLALVVALALLVRWRRNAVLGERRQGPLRDQGR